MLLTRRDVRMVKKTDVEVVIYGFDLTEDVLGRDYGYVGAAVVEGKDQ